MSIAPTAAGVLRRNEREQEMPKIRHLAVICMDPEKLARFYCDVFEMTEVTRATRNGRTNVFLTDGYMNLALLSQKAEGKANGLNHFGFHVEDADVIAERLKNWDVVGPSDRPPDRVYAEQRATDPEGNMYDIAEGGFDRDLATPKKTRQPVTA
jgi:catechol 2,3-dioxygenase-like lactoylglutathione lyase family enzyme